MLIISCHADTGFGSHSLKKLDDGLILGHLDNFIGVHSVMLAYFSGRMNQDYVRIELTYDEEGEFAGAYEVLETLDENDFVIVIDVTATPTQADIVFEKCRNPEIRCFIEKALHGMKFDIYEDCPDPVACSDEADVYSEKCPRTCFMGIPLFGGDYNAGPVLAKETTPAIIAEAICRIAETFGDFNKS